MLPLWRANRRTGITRFEKFNPPEQRNNETKPDHAFYPDDITGIA
jgi:hypothetical protein